MPEFLFEPTPNDEAASFLRRKKPLKSALFNQLLPELRAHSFTVAGVGQFDALQELRDTVATVPEGADFDQVRAAVAATLARHLPVDPSLFPDEEEAEKAAAQLARKAEMVTRNNAFQAYGYTSWAELNESRDLLPYWQYLTVGDERVRDTHRALNNLILPHDHEFWQAHTPPWDFGCRCQIVGLTQEEYDEQRELDQRRPREQRWVLEGEDLERLEKERTLFRNIGGVPQRISVQAAREREEPNAWRFDPTDLALTWRDIEQRYDPATWRAFQGWAKRVDLGQDQGTLYDWLRGAVAAGRRKARRTAAKAAAAATASTAPRTVSSLRSDLQADLDEWQALETERATLTEEIRAAAPSAERDAKLQRLLDLSTARHDAEARARAKLVLPDAERGKLRTRTDATTRRLSQEQNWQAGQRILESLTAAKLLPEVGAKRTTASRASCDLQSVVKFSPQASASTMAHEFTHAVEFQNPDVMKASQTFLFKRRKKGEKFKGLKTLTKGRVNYAANEVAFEDEFSARGSSHYAGKIYHRLIRDGKGRRRLRALVETDPDTVRDNLYATELLTMGIERLHATPLEFLAQDPEYFEFVLSTLQDLNP